MKRSLILLCSLAPLLAAAQRATKPARFDAAVVAIIVPSDDPAHAALNPAVQEPRIVLANKGTESLSGISVRYGTVGFAPRMFAWTGRLAPGATTEVKLTHLIDMRPGLNTFTVSLGDPNGRKDRNKADNTLSGTFTSADAWGSPLTVRMRLPAGNGGRIRLESTRGPVHIDHAWKAGNDTVLSETLRLPPGSYLLHAVDSGKADAASVRIISAGAELLKALRSSPKEGALYQFKVEADASLEATGRSDALLFAQPGRGKALADVFASKPARLVVLDSRGEALMEWQVPEQLNKSYPIDLSAQPVSSYTVLLIEEGRETSLGQIDLY
ncbi:MAG: hypothetical protein IPM12_04795 [Flavobacteriales bacterium]|nr:hypothetical protein [Flavobacteriales bacterium]